jgi:hypothetical protein
VPQPNDIGLTGYGQAEMALVVRQASIYGFCQSLEGDCGGEARVSGNLLSARRTVQACQPERALQGADARQGATLAVLVALHSPPINARICTTLPLRYPQTEA